jgi:hypothetical protein
LVLILQLFPPKYTGASYWVTPLRRFMRGPSSWTQRSHTPLIGQPVNLLEQKKPDHEPGLDPRPALLAVKRSNLAVDPVPIDFAGKQNQLVLHVDDLVQSRPEQVIRSRQLVLPRPHRPSDATQNHGSKRKGIHKRNCKVCGSQAPNRCNLKSSESKK